MADMREVFRTTLEGDATLAGILTGGIYDASELDREGLTISEAQKDSAHRILPAMVIRYGEDQQMGPHFDGERRQVECYLYEHKGYSNIEAAARRIKRLLHKAALSTDDGGRVDMVYRDSTRDYLAPELNNSPARMLRFDLIYTRKV